MKEPIRRAALLKVSLATATAIALLLTASPAQAATPTTHAHPSKTAPVTAKAHPGTPPVKKPPTKKPPKKRADIHFTAEGIVVAHTATTVTLLTHELRVGKTVSHNQLITTHQSHPQRRHALTANTSGTTTDAAAVIGDQMNVTGTVDGTGDTATFTATSQEQHNTAAHAYLGSIQSVNGTTITVSKAPQASDNAEEDNNGQDTFTVDVANASITLDGAAGSLTAGQTVIVLGEGDRDTILAAAVYAYTNAPTVIAGDVTAVTGNILTIGEDDQSTTVDLTAAALVIDGQPAAAPDALTSADTALILGATDTSGVFTPTTAFVFTSHDTHPLPEGDPSSD